MFHYTLHIGQKQEMYIYFKIKWRFGAFELIRLIKQIFILYTLYPISHFSTSQPCFYGSLPVHTSLFPDLHLFSNMAALVLFSSYFCSDAVISPPAVSPPPPKKNVCCVLSPAYCVIEWTV